MSKLKFSRRKVIGSGIAGITSLGVVKYTSAAVVTPEQTEGPFYPIKQQSDKDADLTRVGSNAVVAKGETIEVQGQVFDDDGQPIADAIVDIWQANAAGRYAHERDPNTAELDPNFQGWAIIKTDSKGHYRFKTIRPGAYPVDENWTRPPHIHFKVSRRGFREVTTQMYFEAEPLNNIDRLLNQLSDNQQLALIATREKTSKPFQFDIVLAKV